MSLVIKTNNSSDIANFFDGSLPEGLTGKVDSDYSVGIEVISMLFSFATGVSSGVVANWVWQKLQKSKGIIKLELDGKEIELDVDSISNALIESITRANEK